MSYVNRQSILNGGGMMSGLWTGKGDPICMTEGGGMMIGVQTGGEKMIAGHRGTREIARACPRDQGYVIIRIVYGQRS